MWPTTESNQRGRQVKANETQPPKFRRLMKWASAGFLAAVALDIVLMTFLDSWTAFFIALGLYLALVGPLHAAAQKERITLLHDRNPGMDGRNRER